MRADAEPVCLYQPHCTCQRMRVSACRSMSDHAYDEHTHLRFGRAVPSMLHHVFAEQTLLRFDRDPAEMERVVATNVFGAFATIQAFYPLLKVQHGSPCLQIAARGWQGSRIPCS